MKHAIATALSYAFIWASAAAVYTGTAVLVLRTLGVIR
jgi:hypothetical protein